MMLRLVLVGMVAALGLTIPGGSNRGGWLVSAGRWGNSVLVDLDTWRPDNSSSQPRRVAATRHECEQCRLARAALALNKREEALSRVADSTKSTAVQTVTGSKKPTAESRHVRPADSFRAPTLAIEPIDVGDDSYTGIAFELNRNAEGINLVQSPTAPSAILARSQPVELTEALEPDLPAVLCGATDEDVADWTPVAVTAQRQDENDRTASGALVSVEAGDYGTPEETEATPIPVPGAPPVIAASVQPAAPTSCPELFEVFACRTGPVDEDDAAPYAQAPSMAAIADASKSSVVTERAATLNPASPPVAAESTIQSQVQVAGIPWPVFAPDEPTAPEPTRVVQETTVPWPVFAPLDPTASPKSAAESLSLVAAPRRASSSDAGWGQAVDLTRRAMFAWMGVLVRSAPVEVTAR